MSSTPQRPQTRVCGIAAQSPQRTSVPWCRAGRRCWPQRSQVALARRRRHSQPLQSGPIGLRALTGRRLRRLRTRRPGGACTTSRPERRCRRKSTVSRGRRRCSAPPAAGTAASRMRSATTSPGQQRHRRERPRAERIRGGAAESAPPAFGGGDQSPVGICIRNPLVRQMSPLPAHAQHRYPALKQVRDLRRPGWWRRLPARQRALDPMTLETHDQIGKQCIERPGLTDLDQHPISYGDDLPLARPRGVIVRVVAICEVDLGHRGVRGQERVTLRNGRRDSIRTVHSLSSRARSRHTARIRESRCSTRRM